MESREVCHESDEASGCIANHGTANQLYAKIHNVEANNNVSLSSGREDDLMKEIQSNSSEDGNQNPQMTLSAAESRNDEVSTDVDTPNVTKMIEKQNMDMGDGCILGQSEDIIISDRNIENKNQEHQTPSCPLENDDDWVHLDESEQDITGDHTIPTGPTASINDQIETNSVEDTGQNSEETDKNYVDETEENSAEYTENNSGEIDANKCLDSVEMDEDNCCPPLLHYPEDAVLASSSDILSENQPSILLKQDSSVAVANPVNTEKSRLLVSASSKSFENPDVECSYIVIGDRGKQANGSSHLDCEHQGLDSSLVIISSSEAVGSNNQSNQVSASSKESSVTDNTTVSFDIQPLQTCSDGDDQSSANDTESALVNEYQLRESTTSSENCSESPLLTTSVNDATDVDDDFLEEDEDPYLEVFEETEDWSSLPEKERRKFLKLAKVSSKFIDDFKTTVDIYFEKYGKDPKARELIDYILKVEGNDLEDIPRKRSLAELEMERDSAIEETNNLKTRYQSILKRCESITQIYNREQQVIDNVLDRIHEDDGYLRNELWRINKENSDLKQTVEMQNAQLEELKKVVEKQSKELDNYAIIICTVKKENVELRTFFRDGRKRMSSCERVTGTHYNHVVGLNLETTVTKAGNSRDEQLHGMDIDLTFGKTEVKTLAEMVVEKLELEKHEGLDEVKGRERAENLEKDTAVTIGHLKGDSMCHETRYSLDHNKKKIPVEVDNFKIEKSLPLAHLYEGNESQLSSERAIGNSGVNTQEKLHQEQMTVLEEEHVKETSLLQQQVTKLRQDLETEKSFHQEQMTALQKEHEGEKKKMDELQKEHQREKEQMTALQKEHEGEKKKMDELQKEHQREKEQMTALQKEHEGEKKKMDELQKEHQREKEQMTALQKEHERDKEQMTALQKEHEGEKKKMDELQKEHQREKEQMTALQKEHEGEKKKMDELQKEHQREKEQMTALQKEHEGEKKKMDELQKEHQREKEQMTALQKEHEGEKKKMDELQKEHQREKEQMTALQKEHERDKEQMTALQKEHEGEKKKMDELQKEHQREKEQMTALQKEHEGEKKKMDELQKEHQREKEQMTALQKEHERDKEQMIALQKEHEREKEKMDELQKEHDREKEQMTALQEEHKREKEQMDELKKEQEKEKEQMTAQQKENEKEISVLKNEIKTFTEQLAELQRQMQTLQLEKQRNG